MPAPRLRTPVTRTLAPPIDFDAVRRRLGIPSGYPDDAVQQAIRAAAHPPVPELDRTDIPLVTIDPPGSMDLDQAIHLERADQGYRVHYAIADVAGFVPPTGPLQDETWRRGQTQYSPDLATPLHPVQLSEGAASLLPDQDRPAVLWTIELDTVGEPVTVDLVRALVRSKARLDYPGVQADIDAGRPHPSIALLPEIGAIRQDAARARHAITLAMPDAEVEPAGDGHWRIDLRAPLPVEGFNAEISLLTGICAAQIMLTAGTGLLRTLPAAPPDAVAQLQRSAAALGIRWPAGAPPGDVIATVDPATPKGLAFLEDAVRLLRGAGYTPFHETPPAQTFHAGVGAPYAHVTAPLRRLADRYATEICLAEHGGSAIPDWVLGKLEDLPAVMTGSDRLAGDLERASTWAVIAFLLTDRVGDRFPATVIQIDAKRHRATVLLADPPVRAQSASAGLFEGSEVTVELESVAGDAQSLTVRPV